MSSEVSICNMGLGHIGTKTTISSLDENTNEARQCKIFYADARDAVLRAHPWKFAQKRVALALLSGNPLDWSYKYQYPTDCVMALEIHDAVFSRTAGDPYPFTPAVADDLNSKVILTDKEDAYLKYTARVTNPTLFDTLFVQTLGWYMAFLLAKPLTGKDKIEANALTGYRISISEAQTLDRQEGEPDRQRDAEHILARE